LPSGHHRGDMVFRMVVSVNSMCSLRGKFFKKEKSN